jgi:competence protein ComEA
MTQLLRMLCAFLLSMSVAYAAVDANTATVDQLQTITGVGPTIAQRIVDERRNGPYRSLDDLQARVRGVGETSIRKMAAAGMTVGGGRARAEPRPDAKAEARAEPRSDAKADGKAGSRPEAKADGKAGPRPEAKADGKAEPGVRANADGKAEPRPKRVDEAPRPSAASSRP